MSQDPSKLRYQQQEQHTADLRETQQQKPAREFASVDELMRFDAAQTVPPLDIANRLNESIAQEPAPKVSWWKKFFS